MASPVFTPRPTFPCPVCRQDVRTPAKFVFHYEKKHADAHPALYPSNPNAHLGVIKVLAAYSVAESYEAGYARFRPDSPLGEALKCRSCEHGFGNRASRLLHVELVHATDGNWANGNVKYNTVVRAFQSRVDAIREAVRRLPPRALRPLPSPSPSPMIASVPRPVSAPSPAPSIAPAPAPVPSPVPSPVPYVQGPSPELDTAKSDRAIWSFARERKEQYIATNRGAYELGRIRVKHKGSALTSKRARAWTRKKRKLGLDGQPVPGEEKLHTPLSAWEKKFGSRLEVERLSFVTAVMSKFTEEEGLPQDSVIWVIQNNPKNVSAARRIWESVNTLIPKRASQRKIGTSMAEESPELDEFRTKLQIEDNARRMRAEKKAIAQDVARQAEEDAAEERKKLGDALRKRAEEERKDPELMARRKKVEARRREDAAVPYFMRYVQANIEKAEKLAEKQRAGRQQFGPTYVDSMILVEPAEYEAGTGARSIISVKEQKERAIMMENIQELNATEWALQRIANAKRDPPPPLAGDFMDIDQ